MSLLQRNRNTPRDGVIMKTLRSFIINKAEYKSLTLKTIELGLKARNQYSIFKLVN